MTINSVGLHSSLVTSDGALLVNVSVKVKLSIDTTKDPHDYNHISDVEISIWPRRLYYFSIGILDRLTLIIMLATVISDELIMKHL